MDFGQPWLCSAQNPGVGTFPVGNGTQTPLLKSKQEPGACPNLFLSSQSLGAMELTDPILESQRDEGIHPGAYGKCQTSGLDLWPRGRVI